MLRYRMSKLIRLLEKNDLSGFNAAISSEKYLKALEALENEHCVKISRDWSGNISRVVLLSRHVSYQLSRHEVWLNRFFGFIAGVATSVVAHYLISAADLWLTSR